MSENIADSLHTLVTQVSSIRLKLELIQAKHPELAELSEIVALTDAVQGEIAQGMAHLDLPPSPR